MEVGIVGDFAKQVVLASGSITAGYCIRTVVDHYNKRSFRRAFGAGVQKPSDILISVPLWRSLEGDRSTPRFLKVDSFGARDEHYGPSEMYNVDDMEAAAFVLNIIANHFPDPATYTNDAQQPDWNAKTVIIVGSPIANFHARYYLHKFAQAGGGLGLPCFEDMVEDETTGAKVAIRIPGIDKPMMSGIDKDYGLILRLPNMFCTKGQFFVFMIAGIHAASTRESARLLSKLWSEAFPWKGTTALVFEMDTNIEGTGRVIHQSSGDE